MNVRREQARADEETFARLKAELRQSFSAPERCYREVDVDAVIANVRRRAAG